MNLRIIVEPSSPRRKWISAAENREWHKVWAMLLGLGWKNDLPHLMCSEDGSNLFYKCVPRRKL